MQLVNIYNKNRKIYLFKRNNRGELTVEINNSFFPYFYTPCVEGNYKGYKGESLKKVIVSTPKEVAKNRTDNSYESDIIFTRRYLIDKIDEIEKTDIKYCFLDIEVQSTKKPNVQRAEYPISCISVYNSLYKNIQTFFLADYEDEPTMLNEFIVYMKKESFDIWFSWYIRFDYHYLSNRYNNLTGMTFAEEISPIGQVRYGDKELFYPAGISIVDYLTWFKIITQNRERQYTLDHIAERHLGAGKTHTEVDFSKLSEEVKERNREDVEIMQHLEEKKKLIPYFDEIRRLAKVEWEDLIYNSRIIDALLLSEAKRQNVVLPMRQKDVEKEEFEGAYREAFKTGAFWNIGKYDLSSAYPNAIIDFCLDPANIENLSNKAQLNEIDNNKLLQIENTYFKQNSNALLPTVVKKLITLKTEIKQKLSTTSTEDKIYKDIKKMYDAIKAVVNSAYGVFGSPYFRLFDPKVASATTYIVRSILHHVKDNCEKDGHKVIYVDTDSVFIQSSDNLTDYLNRLIKEWYKTKYNKENHGIEFEYEGQFEKLLILTKCRYKGHLRKPNGDLDIETKGIESKRKDSNQFIKEFQTELIDKIFNKEDKESIFEWIKLQVEKVKNAKLAEISFPCKLGRDPNLYKNTPIFLRALRNTEGFEKNVGDPYYYIFMKGTDESGKGLVLAFDEKNDKHINRDKIDWEQMINRNILMKLDSIFEAMNWDIGEVIEIKPKKRKRRKKTTKREKDVKKAEV